MLSPFQQFRRLLTLLRSEIPCDSRTLAFAFFTGSVLSWPFGYAFALTGLRFEPPEWIEPLYAGTALISFILLPIWSVSALRNQPLLRRIGLATFHISLIVSILLGLLFPVI